MKQSILLIAAFLMSSMVANAQFKNLLKTKVKDNIKNLSGGTTTKSNQKTVQRVTLEELNETPYSDEDRILMSDNGPLIFKGTYRQDFKDDIDFSGFYYLNSYAIVPPANHFSRDTTKAYGGFSIEYAQDKHTMQIHWSNSDANYAMIPDQYKTSADKGNVLFKMGMTGGPESYFNAECLVLEPGVILIGANVYRKNDKEGHAWMNNITPETFIIAAKDTSKFKEYQANPTYTSKVVFEKFDALWATWQNQEIKEAKPLPSEGMKITQLKNDATALIKKTAQAYHWKEEVLYAYINSTDWEIKRHPITNVPLKRIVKAIVVMKTPQGNYKREGFYIAQNYTGHENYGKTYMLYNDQRIYYVNPKDAFLYK